MIFALEKSFLIGSYLVYRLEKGEGVKTIVKEKEFIKLQKKEKKNQEKQKNFIKNLDISSFFKKVYFYENSCRK